MPLPIDTLTEGKRSETAVRLGFKATIYKHWPSRTAAAAEAFGSVMARGLPLPDTGSTVGDLTEQLVRASAFYASARGQVFAQLPARGHHRTVAAGVTRGDVGVADEGGEDTAIDDVIDVLFGPLIFRRLTGHCALTEVHARRLAQVALGGLLALNVRESG